MRLRAWQGREASKQADERLGTRGWGGGVREGEVSTVPHSQNSK